MFNVNVVFRFCEIAIFNVEIARWENIYLRQRVCEITREIFGKIVFNFELNSISYLAPRVFKYNNLRSEQLQVYL